MPSARSSPSDPVGMTWPSRSVESLPSRMIAPLPNCLSIAASARSMALSRAWFAALLAALEWFPPRAVSDPEWPAWPALGVVSLVAMKLLLVVFGLFGYFGRTLTTRPAIIGLRLVWLVGGVQRVRCP